MAIVNHEWNFVRLNGEITLIQVSEILLGIKGVFKTIDDRICTFQLFDDNVTQFMTEETSPIKNRSWLFNTLTQFSKVEYWITDASSLLISIEIDKNRPIYIKTEMIELSKQDAFPFLMSSCSFLMRNYLSLFHFKQCLCHLTREKDRAIEFLGNTAADYGANKAVTKWAPKESRNYKILMKFKENIFQNECIVDDKVDPDIFNIDELNRFLKRFSSISMNRSVKKGNISEEKRIQESKPWASDFGDGESDQDSFLAKYDLGDEMNLKLTQETLEEGSNTVSITPNDESLTDIEFESPQKRQRGT